MNEIKSRLYGAKFVVSVLHRETHSKQEWNNCYKRNCVGGKSTKRNNNHYGKKEIFCLVWYKAWLLSSPELPALCYKQLLSEVVHGQFVTIR